MKVGDLVRKVKGYGASENWVGIILDFIKDPRGIPKISVLTEDGVEWWYSCMVEIVDKDRFAQEE